MPMFRTAEELEQRYAVTAARLLAYAMRGNLAMRRENGEPRFDEAAVARLFPRRTAFGVSMSEPNPRPGFGTLGAYRLGEPPSAAD